MSRTIYKTLILLLSMLPIILISGASIRNNVAISISHIHLYNKPIIKMIHYTVNITTTEAKLFTIKCGINQAISIPNTNHIIIITDSLHTAKRIFDSLLYPYQIYSAVISQELRDFFRKNSNNYIEFWDCPSKQNWLLYFLVDKDTRKFDFSPIFPCKLSWDSCKKYNCNFITIQWRMSFQVSDLKERNFLELLNDKSNPLKPSNIKSGPCLQYFGHSNSRATRAIVNYVSIRNYWLRFFPREEFACLCSLYPIVLRQHILHECKRFNNYWNLKRVSIGHFILFLIYNGKAFSFEDSIAWSTYS